IIHGHTCEIRDVDGDGHLDIFIGEMGKPGAGDNAKTYIWYGNSRGSFQETVASHGQGIHEGLLADLDGDKDLDILMKPYNHNSPRVDVLLNQGKRAVSLDKWKRHAIADLPARSMFILGADVDSDGYRDLIAGGWWWKNPGNLGGTWKQFTIGEPLRNMAIVYDFDEDGDPDVLGTQGVGSAKNTDFVWAQNDGKGQFTIRKNINYTGGGDFLQGCTAARVGKTIRVALSWHRDGGGIYTLNVPAKSAEKTWTTTLLSTTVSTPPQGEDLDFGDIDRDGDLDLLLGDLWLRNDGDSWPTFRMGKITNGEPDRVDLADVNGDGKLDAVVALEKGTDVWWFEAPEDPTGTWTQHKLGVIAGQGFSMDTTDFDGDGDPDVVIGEHRGKTENRVVLFENINNGSIWREHIIDRDAKDKIDHHDGTQAVDLDNDGDLDIISVGWNNPKVWVYENL
ncbi:MAG: VCBS repeat-containing protein, partial [Sedimentisphaerales bacterium]|nr:VCBS repeat-containing protein [Sedimentisphaerales bacterium]